MGSRDRDPRVTWCWRDLHWEDRSGHLDPLQCGQFLGGGFRVLQARKVFLMKELVG